MSENIAKGRQGKERLQIANFRLSSVLTDNSNHSSTTCSGGWRKHFKNCHRNYLSSQSKLLTFIAKKKINNQVNISLDGLGIKQVESVKYLRVHIDGNVRDQS